MYAYPRRGEPTMAGNITPISTKRQQAGADNPNARFLGDYCAGEMQRAITTASVILCTIEDRKLRPTDWKELTEAGMAAWRCAIFKLVGEEAINPEIRALA